MKKFKEEQEQVDPLELVKVFARASNYPKDPAALQYLAQGLVKASNATGAPMEEIIEKCLFHSDFCPTDAQMMLAAEFIMAPPERDWRKPAQCDKCQDSGWQSFERNGVDVAAYCLCSAGQALKAAEQKRRAKIAERKIKAGK